MISSGHRAQRRTATTLLLAAVLALAPAGCGAAKHRAQAGAAGPARPGTARANPHYGAPGATLRIVSPESGGSVRQPLVVKVEVTGFHLSAALAAAPRKGWGHLHFRMDGGRYDVPRYSGANGKLAARLGVAGRFSPAARPIITYRGLPGGRHSLVVSLANNDLSETGIRARAVFTVRSRR